jgi:proteasome beta subunit
VTLPLFTPDQDPGPSFLGLLDRLGMAPPEITGSLEADAITHGTTVLAIRTVEGVVMAGDRRATSGNFISHHSMEKVFPADRHSGVAIAGAAGPAMEMVGLFQLNLEHYEKVEGSPLSLEGKANQLSQMVRSNLSAAMQGLGVVPLFAGWDERLQQGRLFQYDITGGRYEERRYAAGGSGSLHSSTVIKLRHTPDLDFSTAVDIAVEALFEAADEDTATGGPDPVRGIYPVIATIGSDGFERMADEDVAARTTALLERLGDRSGR